MSVPLLAPPAPPFASYEQTFAVLKALYESTDGANWTSNAGWLDASVDLCSKVWFGVGCPNASSFVAGYNPVNWIGGSQPLMNLQGTLPTELGILFNQDSAFPGNNFGLQIGGNPELSGTLPTEIFSADSKLFMLNVQADDKRSRLSGTIPSTLAKLVSLQVKTTDISGTIASSWFSRPHQEANMNMVSIGHTLISGTIPTTIGQLQKNASWDSTNLLLESTRLNGTIPTELGKLGTIGSSLRSLHLDQNDLSGTIPTELGLLSKVVEVTWYGNRLTGTLPTELNNWKAVALCQFTWFQVNYKIGQDQSAKSPHRHNHFHCPESGAIDNSLNYACQANLFCSGPPHPPPPNVPPPPQAPPAPAMPAWEWLVIGLLIAGAILLACLGAWVRERLVRKEVREKLWVELQDEVTANRKMTVKAERPEDPPVPLAKAIQEAMAASRERSRSATAANPRFTISFSDLITGAPVASALGVISRLGYDEDDLRARTARGVQAIEDEIASRGTDDDKENLRYVLYERAGSNPKTFPNSPHPRDHNRNGEAFFDFVAAPEARTAQLSPAHVCALRLYTCSTFKSINEPLRRGNVGAATAAASPNNDRHPLPCTVLLLNEAIRKLRAVDATKGDGSSANEALDLWRGIRDCRSTEEFDKHGGSEFAPMSTTSDLKVACQYANSGMPLILKIATSGFINRGADLAWCSAFPNESEYVFPPLTYLEPTGRKEEVEVNDQLISVVEVVPHL